MAIPKFDDLMLPVLKLHWDQKEHHRKEFVEILTKQLNLTEEDKNSEIRPGHSRFWDRIHWATIILRHWGMLESTRRWYNKITALGTKTLAMNLSYLWPKKIEEINPEVKNTPFWNPRLRDSKNGIEENSLNEQTPDETLKFILREKESLVKSELTEQIKNISPRSFEILVTKLLVAMKYGTEEFSITTSYTNDNWIDGIIQSDELGFEKIYVQAKKYEWSVGRPDMQKFVWAMTGTSKGVFITTSDFSSWVFEYLKSRQEKVILINGIKLVDLMYRYNQWVSVRDTIELKWIDGDYFEELE